jgi:hypothetical protein
MMVSLLVVVLSLEIVSTFYTDYPAYTNHQVSDETVLTEMDIMIMIKKKSFTSNESNWKSTWMSQVMSTFQNKDSKQDSFDPKHQHFDPHENSESIMLHPKYTFPYGIIARKGILMQLK